MLIMINNNIDILHNYKGPLDQKIVDMLVIINSGSSISLIQKGVPIAFSRQIEKSLKGLQLIPVKGKEIPVLEFITISQQLGKLQVNHNFMVVHSLIALVILGVDFLQKYNLVLDFPSYPVSITPKTVNEWKTPGVPRGGARGYLAPALRGPIIILPTKLKEYSLILQ